MISKRRRKVKMVREYHRMKGVKVVPSGQRREHKGIRKPKRTDSKRKKEEPSDKPTKLNKI